MLSELANNLLLIAQTKHLLKLAINKLIPGSIDNDTPFRDYPDILDEYEPAPQPVQDEGFRDVISVGEGMVDEISMGEKYYTPAVTHEQMIISDPYTSVSNNSNNWGYDSEKGFYNNKINDSETTQMVLKVDDYRNICYPNLANVMPVTFYQSSENGYDYGILYGSYDGVSLDSMIFSCQNLSGQTQQDFTITTFYPYLILHYRKDGGSSSGEDRCYFKFDRLSVQVQTIIDTPEVIYYNDTIE